MASVNMRFLVCFGLLILMIVSTSAFPSNVPEQGETLDEKYPEVVKVPITERDLRVDDIIDVGESSALGAAVGCLAGLAAGPLGCFVFALTLGTMMTAHTAGAKMSEQRPLQWN